MRENANQSGFQRPAPRRYQRKYFTASFTASVFPAPDSPDTKIVWSSAFATISKYALCATDLPQKAALEL